jgi:hypothetical protein
MQARKVHVKIYRPDISLANIHIDRIISNYLHFQLLSVFYVTTLYNLYSGLFFSINLHTRIVSSI